MEAQKNGGLTELSTHYIVGMSDSLKFSDFLRVHWPDVNEAKCNFTVTKG